MFQHLITFHHVFTWAQEHSDNVPEDEGKLIDLCRTLVEGDIAANVRTVVSDKLHEKCRKAKIREVDLFLSKQNASTSKELNCNNNSGGTFVDDVSQKSANSPLTRNTESTSRGDYDLHETFLVPHEPDYAEAGDDEERVVPASVHVDATHQNEKDVDTVKQSGEHHVNDKDKDNTVGSFNIEIENPTASYFERIENAAYELPEIIEFGGTKAPSTMCWINSSTLKAVKKEEPVSASVPNNVWVQSLPAIFPTYSAASSVVSDMNANVEEEIQEFSIRRRKKSETLSPFVSYYDSPSFKEESPRDLLQGVSDSPLSSKTKQIEAAKKDPEKVFYEKVVNMVKINLNRYFAKSSENMFDKAGKPKQIKIKDSKEYATYCRHFSKKFSKDIKETFELTNGNLEGIEKLSVLEYGLEHDIHKHFSDRPCVNVKF